MIENLKTPIIDQIEKTVKEIPGWSPLDQLYTLFNLVYQNGDLEGDIIEIGSWCGRSAAVLGMAARLIGNTKVHCIDLFPGRDDWKMNPDGTYSFEVRINDVSYAGYEDPTVWKEPYEKDIRPLYEKHESLLDIFTQTVEKTDLSDLVRAYKGDSTLFTHSVKEGFKCKLAFIDGDHGYDAVCRDIRNVERYLVDGGWICFDDAFSSYKELDRAIGDLIIPNPAYDLCQQMTRKFFVARRNVK